MLVLTDIGIQFILYFYFSYSTQTYKGFFVFFKTFSLFSWKC